MANLIKRITITCTESFKRRLIRIGEIHSESVGSIIRRCVQYALPALYPEAWKSVTDDEGNNDE